MKEYKFCITYIDDKGKCKTIERTETMDELKERLKFYKEHDFQIMAVIKEVITYSNEFINWKEVIK